MAEAQRPEARKVRLRSTAVGRDARVSGDVGTQNDGTASQCSTQTSKTVMQQVKQ